MWDAAVGTLQSIIFAIGHFAGASLGSGIFLTTLLLRLALLPLSLRLARRAREQQERFARLQPRLKELQGSLKADPVRLQRETFALFRAEGYQPIDGQTFLGTLVQLPPLSTIYAVLRRGIAAGIPFAWIPDLARPDTLLALLVTLLAAGGGALAAPASAGRNAWATSALIAGGMTFLFVYFTSSAMALTVAANGLIGLGQNLWLRRERRARTT